MMLRGGRKRAPACRQSTNRGAEPAPPYNEHYYPGARQDNGCHDRWPKSLAPILDRTIAPARRQARKDRRTGRTDRSYAVARTAYQAVRRTVAHGRIKSLDTGAASRFRAWLADCHARSAGDHGELRVEHDQSNGPFGAKGVGESAMFGVSPAIANALAHAVGIRLTSLALCAETAYRAICAKAGYPARGGKDVTRAEVCRVTLVRGWS